MTHPWPPDHIATLAPDTEVLHATGFCVVTSENSTTLFTTLLQNLIAALENSPTIAALRQHFPDYALQHLIEKRIAIVSPSPQASPSAAFWHTVDRQPSDVEVHLHELGATLPLTPDLLDTPQSTTPPKPIRILATDDYLRPEVAQLCLDPSVPTLLVRPVGRHLHLGPLLNTPTSICYECLRFRLRLPRWKQELASDDYPPQPAIASLPSGPALAGALTAAAIERFGADDPGALTRTITTFDTWTLQTDSAPLLALTSCACNTDPQPDRARALTHPLTGILDQPDIRPIPNSPFYAALSSVRIHPAARRLRPWDTVAASGSGPDEHSARTSLFYEAIERYSAYYTGAEPIAPNHTLQVRNLSDDAAATIPAHGVYLGFPPDQHTDTNGCAAAPSLDQALTHAIYEVIERDALAHWWFDQLERPTIDLTSPFLTHATAALAEHRRTLQFVNITASVPLPVIAAVSADAGGAAIYIGAAADTTALRAAERATLELLQFWFWDTTKNQPARTRARWLAEATLNTHPFLKPRSPAPPPPTATGAPRQLLTGHTASWVDLTRDEIGIPVVRVIAPSLLHIRRPPPSRTNAYDCPL